MPNPLQQLYHFWKELKRRKVLYFLIGYVAACFAIIEFFDVASDRFTIPDRTFDLLYIIAAIGLPLVVVLPWFINRKERDEDVDSGTLKSKPQSKDEKRPHHNLPAQLTTFIGRKKEMKTVRELLDDHRIVSLTGSGGSGKTRLAIEVAVQLVPDYEDGVWFVDLAPIADGDLVANEFMEVLEIKEIPKQQNINTLINQIKEKSLLIILDNCEHLLSACTEITSKLLQSAPGLKILVTSREALNISGEQVWRVPSLSLPNIKTIPDVENAKESEAVLMFIDRARLNNTEFDLVTENVKEVVTICNKLDGIPLAIELVASRTRFMSIQMILDRLSDRFDRLSSSDPGVSKRQQTLQSTIEWSYNLLSEEEKLLYTRLGVFVGGFDISAVEEVCADDQLLKESILDLLSRLVDRSMVYISKCRDQSIRYALLETLRQFAQQLLQSADEKDDIRNRHLQYYLKLAEESYAERTEFQQKWMKKLDLDHDNMIAALNWSEIHSVDSFVRLSAALAWYWSIHTYFLLGMDYLERALSMDVKKSEFYARAQYGLGMFLWFTGDLSRGIEILEYSLKLMRKFNCLSEEASILTELSRLYHTTRDHETGMKYSQQSIEIAKSIGNPGLINSCLCIVCMSHIFVKQYKTALPLAEEVIASSANLEQPIVLLTAHHFYNDCDLGTGNFEEAEKGYGMNIERAIKYGNEVTATIELQGVALSVAAQKRWVKAIRLNAAAKENASVLGTILPEKIEFWGEWVDTYIGGARKELAEEMTLKCEEEGRAMGFDKAVAYALDFDQD